VRVDVGTNASQEHFQVARTVGIAGNAVMAATNSSRKHKHQQLIKNGAIATFKGVTARLLHTLSVWFCVRFS
jgi:hypothetical protein